LVDTVDEEGRKFLKQKEAKFEAECVLSVFMFFFCIGMYISMFSCGCVCFPMFSNRF
jgi:hypothetical protein